MKSKAIALVVMLLVPATAASTSAQEYHFGSATSQGVAGVVTLIPSSPSVMTTHPSLLDFASGRQSAELSYRQLFGLSSFEDFSAQGRYRFRSVSGGLTLSRFGESELYQEYFLSAACALLLKRELSVGIAVRYASVEFGDGVERYAGGDIAISASYRPVSTLLMSSAVRSIVLDRVYDADDGTPVFETSVAWSSASEVSLGGIWTREPDGAHRFALGQTLTLTPHLDFLAGLRFDPIRYALGGRARYSALALSYAYEGHPELGATHSFGIAWDK